LDDGYAYQTTKASKLTAGFARLILFWLLSFPLALAAMVYVLGLV
jgi:hypothetical protein